MCCKGHVTHWLAVGYHSRRKICQHKSRAHVVYKYSVLFILHFHAKVELAGYWLLMVYVIRCLIDIAKWAKRRTRIYAESPLCPFSAYETSPSSATGHNRLIHCFFLFQ